MTRGIDYDAVETIIILDMYRHMDFGDFRNDNPRIVETAALLSVYRGFERTPGGVRNKMENFKAIDPAEKAKGHSGRSHYARLMEATWNSYDDDEELRKEAEALRKMIAGIANKPNYSIEAVRKLIRNFNRDSSSSAYSRISPG